MEANTSRMVNLNGSIYHVWKEEMEDLLYVKDYYLPVFSIEKPENKTDAEWTILHRQDIINQLASMGIMFEDEIQGLWLLGSILNEEMRRKSQGSSLHSNVLVIERQGRSKSRGPSNKGNHRSSSSKGKFGDVECYHCYKKGHTMKFYRQLKKENKKKNYNNQKNKHKKDDDGDFGVVRMGNTGLSRIAGIGDICLKFDTGMELVLHNVKHVPDIRLNIISTGLLDEDGYHNSSGNGLWKVTLGSLIVVRGKRESKLYMTHPKISKSIVNAIDNNDMTELWHKRLGHMSEKRMFILSKKNVLSGVHDINLKKCSHCLAVKQTRRAFKSRPSFRMENILDLFHVLVERQTGKKLKCIRSDNGGEYIGPFDAYCREHGIQHQKTPPKTPQLNGLAERMNITLVERVRCLLSHVGVWSGKDVSYHHLLVFGCKASVHIPKDERSKLDVKNKPCVFLGYGQDTLGAFTDAESPSVMKSYGQDETQERNYFDAMQEENARKSLYENNTFELTKLPKGKRALKNKWVYKLRLKSILLDRDGIYLEFSGFGASLYLEVEQMDVNTAFLHGDMDKEIYMEQPEDLGPTTQILAFEFLRDKRCQQNVHISQEQYIEKVLRRFNMDKAKVKNTAIRVPYPSAVGAKPDYAIVSTRPDLAQGVGVVSFGSCQILVISIVKADLLKSSSAPRKRPLLINDTLAWGTVSWQSRLQKLWPCLQQRLEYRLPSRRWKFELNKVHQTDDNASDKLKRMRTGIPDHLIYKLDYADHNALVGRIPSHITLRGTLNMMNLWIIMRPTDGGTVLELQRHEAMAFNEMLLPLKGVANCQITGNTPGLPTKEFEKILLWSQQIRESLVVVLRSSWLLVNNISSVVLSQSSNRWVWRLDSSGDFLLKSARCFIDDSFPPKEVPTRWVKSIPIKVNNFAWKVCLDKVPTRLKLSLCGLDIPYVLSALYVALS
ncbi:putative RNA-directed DNA polymerase [Tanacetum coccineum]